MKFKVKIHHLPSGKVWESNTNEAELENVQELCELSAKGKANYLKLECGEEYVYFSAEIMENSTISYQEIKE